MTVVEHIGPHTLYLGDARDVIKTLADLKEVAKCEHDMVFLGWNATGGQQHRCNKCRCRFTSWPGGNHFDSAQCEAANGKG